MSLILWYKIEVSEAAPAGGLLAAAASLVGKGLPLKVSNDSFSGQYLLDSDIRLNMPSGATAGSFDVTIRNLPVEIGDTIKSMQNKAVDGKAVDGKEPAERPAPLRVKVFLGYFEDVPMFTSASRDPVMEGAVTRVKSKVDDQGNYTLQLLGQELAGYKLRSLKAKDVETSIKGDATQEKFLESLAKKAGLKIAEGDPWTGKETDFTLKAENGLLALEALADRADSSVVVRDGKIYRGSAVGAEEAPETLDPDRNLVKVDEDHDTDEKGGKASRKPKAKAKVVTTRKAVSLGIPGLRAGQSIKLKGKGGEKSLRIHSVQHNFLTSQGGYTCELVLVEAKPGVRVPSLHGVDGMIDRIDDFIRSARDEKTPIDVGEVASYASGNDGKHLVTLNYGQSEGTDRTVPSVQAKVDTDTQLHDKPIASPFAWHKCGLVVPAYPSMRALLAHNQGTANDAAVVGFLWAENPPMDRPKNQQGDYWLCLPTEIDPATKRPKGAAANDLIDAQGRRVIQAKGVRLMVGAKLLSPVGDRPVPGPEIDDAITIEHASGTTIKIDSNGAVTIAANGQKITLSNGSVSLSLDGKKVEIK